MEPIAYRTVSLQAAIALAGAALAYWGAGPEAAKSAFYGGIVATVNGLSLLRKVRLAEEMAKSSPRYALAILYSGAVTRFVLVLLLFGVAFGALHLRVVPALLVFAIAQLAYGWGLRESYKDLL